ncbi:ACP S-malonyltransferase [Serpentinicella alkaliphila]|uniref:Malonyl CoA-acyl carrier protein transacylase n=1 Tax=Serpentinicella alkaliphila TaxID=1734049 RepID=A0A4R2TSF0_9FIRM|nr:ACP S-malonyltransferase [Serpentinicella alkaliphila]QUH26251.1 ACP S-malonyltransferase [Serpentinicella alkaliphila]TCQ05827.1 [acyl-carrier-protein] S-malonyltransferase [Serpentinicella alkaliphila]
MTKLAFVFPGQGSQYVGMGKELFDNFNIVKDTFEEASDSLGLDMKKLCFEGPEDILVQTENTQPAILTTSVAFLRVLLSEGVDCSITAGLSLGEYGALVKSKAIKFTDAVKLVKKRGKFMQEAVPLGIGTMAAILGLEREVLVKCLEESKEYGIVEAANFNSPGQIVISGEVKAVEAAIKKISEAGAKKAVLLPVSAPFHSSLLKPAGDNLKIELNNIEIFDPSIPVVSNVTASKLLAKEEIAPALVKQVSSSVLWHDSVKLMLEEEVSTFIEVGPGKALSAFIKKIAKTEGYKANTLNVDDLNSLKSVLNTIK